MTEEPLASIRGSRILLAVTGGIAAYKAAELLRLLQKAGAEVEVIMTGSATRFVAPATFEALSHAPVGVDTFEHTNRVEHVRLARRADLVVVAPATAHVLAQMRAGLASDLVTNVLLTTTAPIVCAAAMHTEMWEHEATRENVRVLRERGVTILDPDAGDLAGGDVGVGRMLEPEDIRARIADVLKDRGPQRPRAGGDLDGVRILVTAGGTREPIDAVRFITNRSSGRMGYAIAAAAADRGALVTLISGPTHLVPPPVDRFIEVETAAQMAEAVLEAFPSVEVVVKAAAVSDFAPETSSRTKLKKAGGPPEIRLVPTLDILAELGQRSTGQVLVGFSAETDAHLANAREKLQSKNVDLMVLNDVSRSDIGFDSPANEATLIDRSGGTELIEKTSKEHLATIICDRIRGLLDDPERKERL